MNYEIVSSAYINLMYSNDNEIRSYFVNKDVANYLSEMVKYSEEIYDAATNMFEFLNLGIDFDQLCDMTGTEFVMNSRMYKLYLE